MSRVPRVLLAFEPPDGGVAENVLRLAWGLPERGIEVALAGPEEAIIYPQLPAGTRIARLPFERGYGHPLRDAEGLRRLAGLLQRGSFDLLHCHSAKAGVLGRLAGAATGTTVVYSPHCFPFVGPWGLPRKLFATNIERALGPLTDAILCVADQERELALEKHIVPDERLHVVHNGSKPCEAFEPDAELTEFAAGGPLAASMAVLRPQKSVDVFIDAVPRVLARVPQARLAVIGNGPLRAELEQRAAALDHGGHLRFFDFKPPASRQLASIDVFVLPSSWEAFPISILEAMACGVPQVATDVGGTAEALVDGQTGRLVPPHDPPALADAVASLLADDDGRRRMGEQARTRHAERFTLDHMIDRTAAVYRSVLAAR
jgi:glycosyltransferase involved in cell wall biosynthesis